MNWTKTVIAGAVAGFVVSLVNYLLHGVIMADTYRRYSGVFSQEQASPVYFILVSVVIGIFFAILFAKTRECWAAGAKGTLLAYGGATRAAWSTASGWAWWPSSPASTTRS